MQLNMVINDELMQQVKSVAGVKSETEIVEIALRAWLELQRPKKQVENPAKALLESDFVGCGQADPSLPICQNNTNGESIAHLMAQMAKRGTAFQNIDPVTWQREVREDRPLPDRE